VVTTDSRHNLPVYPNLAGQMAPAAINQLWVADITYIRLRNNHTRKVYPNLARHMVLTGMDQLWRADITYIRLREELYSWL